MTSILFTDLPHLKNLIQKADENDKTKILISKFAELQKIRIPFFLTLSEFEEILQWKLIHQYGRQAKIREKNTDHNIRIITKAAFEIKHDNNDIETELRLKILSTLSGVEIPVASAILTLCSPNLYSVIDFRNWRQVYPETNQKTNYTVKEYIQYLKIIRELAKQFGVTPQQIDIAIWQLDKDLYR